MEGVPNVESTEQTSTNNRGSFVESLSRALSGFGMHNSQNATSIEQVPQRDMSQYDVVFPEN
jgi:hypothetical protein